MGCFILDTTSCILGVSCHVLLSNVFSLEVHNGGQLFYNRVCGLERNHSRQGTNRYDIDSRQRGKLGNITQTKGNSVCVSPRVFCVLLRDVICCGHWDSWLFHVKGFLVPSKWDCESAILGTNCAERARIPERHQGEEVGVKRLLSSLFT